MRKFLFSGLMAVIISVCLLYPVAPALSQSCPDPTIVEPVSPPDGCPPNWPVNSLQRHPPQINIIDQAILDLNAMGYEVFMGDCSIPQGNCCPDCGAGIVTRRVAQILGIGILYKTWGAGCDGHSFDVIIFPDGYIYDIIISAGQANIPAWQDICCGLPPEQGGDGTCVERYLDPNLDPQIADPAPPECRRRRYCTPGDPLCCDPMDTTCCDLRNTICAACTADPNSCACDRVPGCT